VKQLLESEAIMVHSGSLDNAKFHSLSRTCATLRDVYLDARHISKVRLSTYRVELGCPMPVCFRAGALLPDRIEM
jgi:hypothetical protein